MALTPYDPIPLLLFIFYYFNKRAFVLVPPLVYLGKSSFTSGKNAAWESFIILIYNGFT
jgi:hypothetical protein